MDVKEFERISRGLTQEWNDRGITRNRGDGRGELRGVVVESRGLT